MASIDDLRSTMLRRRRALLHQVMQVEDDLRWLDMHVNPEVEEESQEASIARLLTRLDERGQAEIEAIDRALLRMASGDYGRCEICDEPIAVGRLEALPTAVTCVTCAEELERGRAASP